MHTGAAWESTCTSEDSDDEARVTFSSLWKPIQRASTCGAHELGTLVPSRQALSSPGLGRQATSKQTTRLRPRLERCLIMSQAAAPGDLML